MFLDLLRPYIKIINTSVHKCQNQLFYITPIPNTSITLKLLQIFLDLLKPYIKKIINTSVLINTFEIKYLKEIMQKLCLKFNLTKFINPPFKRGDRCSLFVNN